jgi:uncharacterized protein
VCHAIHRAETCLRIQAAVRMAAAPAPGEFAIRSVSVSPARSRHGARDMIDRFSGIAWLHWGCHNASTPKMSVPLVPPELLGPVLAYFQPRRVILFGSAARGEAGPDSDIDLLVVLDDDAPPDKLTLRAGYESRASYDHPADIFPCREQTYQRKCQIVGTLPYAARTEGIVVYERP